MILLFFLLCYIDDISEDKLKKILSWKYNHYDKNSNEILEDIETTHLVDEVHDLIGLKAFKKQLLERIETDGDTKISKTEWETYFTGDKGE